MGFFCTMHREAYIQSVLTDIWVTVTMSASECVSMFALGHVWMWWLGCGYKVVYGYMHVGMCVDAVRWTCARHSTVVCMCGGHGSPFYFFAFIVSKGHDWVRHWAECCHLRFILGLAPPLLQWPSLEGASHSLYLNTLTAQDAPGYSNASSPLTDRRPVLSTATNACSALERHQDSR